MKPRTQAPFAQSSELRRPAGTSPPRFVIRVRHRSLCSLRAQITIAPICDAHRLSRGTLSSIVRSDSDKGKTTERWRRKVTGLKSDSSTIAEPPRIPAECSAEVVRSRQAVAAGRVERGDHEFDRFGQCRSVRQQRRSYAYDRRLRHRRGSVQPVDADAMKSSFIGVSALVSALAALVPAGAASAAEITYTAVGGIWHDPVDNLPGSQPADPVITNGVPTSIIRWGDTTGSQSGYDFTGMLPPPFELPGPIPFFSLGSFTHRNFAVDDPSLTSVQLDVVLAINVDGAPRAPLTFTFTFNHQETPNNQTPCPVSDPAWGRVYGPRDDRRVADADDVQRRRRGLHVVDELSQRRQSGLRVHHERRRHTNSTGLVGEFTPPPIPPGTPLLTVDKSGPATMNPAEHGDFAIDVRNAGTVAAFNVTLARSPARTARRAACATPRRRSRARACSRQTA